MQLISHLKYDFCVFCTLYAIIIRGKIKIPLAGSCGKKRRQYEKIEEISGRNCEIL